MDLTGEQLSWEITVSGGCRTRQQGIKDHLKLIELSFPVLKCLQTAPAADICDVSSTMPIIHKDVQQLLQAMG